MARKKYKAKNEFRFSKKTKHPVYIFEDDGKKFNGVGITHKPTTFGKPNMPLEKNPQKGKKEKAYIRNGIISDSHKSFDTPKSNFEFSKEDFPKVKAKIRNYKKERRRKKEKGKSAFYTISFIIFVVVALLIAARLL